jgi:hypothetical protein
MLANLPIAVLYNHFGDVLTNTERVTFVNATSSEITDIRITGCDAYSIARLRPGEKRLICIGIHSDCSVALEYRLGKQRKWQVALWLPYQHGRRDGYLSYWRG